MEDIDFDEISHKIWAAAQLMPADEGIEDGVFRVTSLLVSFYVYIMREIERKEDIQRLINKYEQRIKDIVNPGDLTWKDIGYDEPYEGFDDINDYFENGGYEDFDEGEQTGLMIYREVIDDLEKFLT